MHCVFVFTSVLLHSQFYYFFHPRRFPPSYRSCALLPSLPPLPPPLSLLVALYLLLLLFESLKRSRLPLPPPPCHPLISPVCIFLHGFLVAWHTNLLPSIDSLRRSHTLSRPDPPWQRSDPTSTLILKAWSGNILSRYLSPSLSPLRRLGGLERRGREREKEGRREGEKGGVPRGVFCSLLCL